SRGDEEEGLVQLARRLFEWTARGGDDRVAIEEAVAEGDEPEARLVAAVERPLGEASAGEHGQEPVCRGLRHSERPRDLRDASIAGLVEVKEHVEGFVDGGGAGFTLGCRTAMWTSVP